MRAIAKVTAHMADDPTDIWIVEGKSYDLARAIHEGEDLYHFIDEQGDSHHLDIEDFDRYFKEEYQMSNNQELRPVEVTLSYSNQIWAEKGAPKGVHRGMFHGFFQDGSNEDGIGCMAVVELENGEIITPDAENVKFLDRESEEDECQIIK